jgi:hypothetical protein
MDECLDLVGERSLEMLLLGVEKEATLAAIEEPAHPGGATQFIEFEITIEQ